MIHGQRVCSGQNGQILDTCSCENECIHGWIRESFSCRSPPHWLASLCVRRDPGSEEHLLPASPSEREIAVPVSDAQPRSTNTKSASLNRLSFLFFSWAGSELHSLPAGRLHKVRPAPRLDSLQPRAPGQHWRHWLHGQRHANETQVRLRLAVTRCGKNAGNPIKERVIVSRRGFQ